MLLFCTKRNLCEKRAHFVAGKFQVKEFKIIFLYYSWRNKAKQDLKFYFDKKKFQLFVNFQLINRIILTKGGQPFSQIGQNNVWKNSAAQNNLMGQKLSKAITFTTNLSQFIRQKSSRAILNILVGQKWPAGPWLAATDLGHWQCHQDVI